MVEAAFAQITSKSGYIILETVNLFYTYCNLYYKYKEFCSCNNLQEGDTYEYLDLSVNVYWTAICVWFHGTKNAWFLFNILSVLRLKSVPKIEQLNFFIQWNKANLKETILNFNLVFPYCENLTLNLTVFFYKTYIMKDVFQKRMSIQSI